MTAALRMIARAGRSSRAVVALGLALAGVAWRSGAATAFAAGGAASAVETMTSYLLSLVWVFTPGLAVAGGAYTLYRRKESQPKPMWYLSTALLAMAALSMPLVLNQAPKEVPQEISLRSGEERLMPNGKFKLVSDPRPGSGPAQEGWQQALWSEMAEAITKGEEQVVMVFSRPGCPWCEKLHPVLQNAIKRRVDTLASGPSDDDAPPLLHSPLRVFIYDASEFGPIMRRFGVEGFPTLFFFGPPGSRPTVVPGYLSDQDFDQVATSAANAPVEPEPGQRKKRRGLFR